MSKLIECVTFSGTMTTLSGMHIGGGNESTKVGGCDNPVIRNSLTGLPYIPGTSVKGVLRNQLEAIKGISNEKGNPCGCGKTTCMICKLFGAHMNTRAESGKPRLICRDMTVNKDFLENLLESGKNYQDLIEVVASTAINRNTGTASNGSLRNMEVVAAGTEFDCTFILQIFEGDNKEAMVNQLKSLVEAIETTKGFGSKVTAGKGAVKFDINWSKPVVTKF